MRHWRTRKISDKEYHVVETRYVGEGEFLLAVCSGPVPADDIVQAMFLHQSINDGECSLHNQLLSMKSAVERARQWTKDECSGKQFYEGAGAAIIPFGSHKDNRLDSIADDERALIDIATHLHTIDASHYRCFRIPFHAFMEGRVKT